MFIHTKSITATAWIRIINNNNVIQIINHRKTSNLNIINNLNTYFNIYDDFLSYFLKENKMTKIKLI